MSRFMDVGLAAGFVVMWSSGFIGAELGTRAAAALTVLAWRTIVASSALIVWQVIRGGLRMSRREIGAQAGIGLLSQAGYLVGVVMSVELGVPAGTVALVAALQPIVAAAAAQSILGERMSVRGWTGLGVGLVGVMLVVGGDLALSGRAAPWAYLLPFLAMASLVAGTLLDRRLTMRPDLMGTLTVHTIASAAVIVLVATGTGSLAPPSSGAFWLAVLWTVALSHIAGYAMYWANVRRGGVVRVSALLYLTPAATALWAAAMFDTPLSTLAIIGMILTAISCEPIVRKSVGARHSKSDTDSVIVEWNRLNFDSVTPEARRTRGPGDQ